MVAEFAEFAEGDRVQDCVFDGRYVGTVECVVGRVVGVRLDDGTALQLLAHQIQKIGDPQ